MEDIEERMHMLDFFNIAISLVCFALGFFQLIVSISANIRDSMWELGVLRAIGMTNKEILKITIYESMANNLSSVLLGFLIGLAISVSLVAQFLIFLELPFILIVSYLVELILLVTIQNNHFGCCIEFDCSRIGVLLCDKDSLQKENCKHIKGHVISLSIHSFSI